MSDSSTVMPDSDSLSHASDEAQDSQEIARNAGEDGNTGSSVEGASQENPPEKTENPVLAKRLSDTEAALKDRQREFTEMSLKLAELRGEMNAMAKPEKVQDDPVAEVWDDALKDRFISDPTTALPEIIERQQRVFAKTLDQRDKFWKSEIKSMLDEQLNPERVELRSTIKELSSKQWFQKLSPNEQVEAAKEYRGRVENSVTPPGSSFGGTGRKPPTQSGKTPAEERKARAKSDMERAFSMMDQTNTLMPELTVNSKR